MKLYNSLGPNPRLVRMFAQEKKLDLATEEVDIMGGENRQPAYLEKNPGGQLPALELDDGAVLAETVVICEYLEELHPEPALIGATPEERAHTRMWTRRIEAKIVQPLTDGFRYAEGLGMFKDRLHVIPQAADDLKAIAREKLAWLDELVDGKEFIVGDRFTLADVLLFAFLEFGASVGQPLEEKLGNLPGWYARVAARPSVQAST